MTRVNRGSLILVFALILLSLSSTASRAEWKDRWKLATLAPDGVGWARQIKAIVIPAIDRVTEKNLEIKVYWGGVMGDDSDYIKKMRIDQLQGAGLSGHGVTLAVPEMAVTELPFLFRNWAEVDYIKGRMRDTFDKIAKKNGYFMVAWIDQDFDRMYSVKHDMDSMEDISKIKALSWFGPMEEAVYKALGAVPVPIAMPEAPAAMRSGIGDTITAPAAWMVGTQLYSIAKHVSPLNIRYAPALIVMTANRWATMPQKYQDAYYACRDAVTQEFCQEVRKDNQKCFKAMLDYGVTEKPASDKLIAEAKARTRPLYDKLANDLYPKELLDELLGYLQEYRKTHP
ncbi:MAG: TRAP transporter substrate-binding protein DctP [Thermodesulfobacteriota bacterium]